MSEIPTKPEIGEIEVEAFMMRALHRIIQERAAQNEKWGEQNHQEPMWATILGEEFGEACKAALDYFIEASAAGGAGDETLAQLKKELIQVAAVAVAWYECIERNTKGDL